MAEVNLKKHWFHYLIACLSYVPVLGLVFGAIAIIWGSTKRGLVGKRMTRLAIGAIVLQIGSIIYVQYRLAVTDDAVRAKKEAIYNQLKSESKSH